MTTPVDFYPPENYYRVSLKPLIFDDQGRLLVGKNGEGEWVMIGGGWDHGETWEDCLRRETAEEIGAEVVSVGKAACFYRHTTYSGKPKISIAVPVEVVSHDFVFSTDDDEVVAAKFVTKQEFVELPFMQAEAAAQSQADQIWAVVEKKGENR